MTLTRTGSPSITDEMAAFTEWVEPVIPAMARLAARLAPTADRDDVVQEALLRAWTKRQQYDPAKGTAASWLLAITADQAFKALKRGRPRFGHVRAAEPRGLEATLDIEAAVRRLPPRQRLAVDCFYFVDLSVAETAAVMCCSEGTVKSTLSDARATLRKTLDRA